MGLVIRLNDGNDQHPQQPGHPQQQAQYDQRHRRLLRSSVAVCRQPHDERYFVWWKRTKHDVRTVLNRAGRALRRYKNYREEIK
jgi:hypothetical protein